MDIKMNQFRIELRKAFKNKFFYASLAILLLLAVLSATYVCKTFLSVKDVFLSEKYFIDGKMIQNDIFPVWTSFNYWIGGEGESLVYSLFFTLLPVLAVLPYGWSFLIELQSGYQKQVIVRTNKRIYYLTKFAAVFMSGFCVVVIPMIINFLIVSSVFPSSTPQVNYNFYNYVLFGSLWSDLLFTNPFLYVCLYILLNGIYAGLFSILAMATSFFIKNRVAITLFPFILCLVAVYISNLFGNATSSNPIRMVEIAPTNFLHASQLSLTTVWYVVLLEAVVLLVGSAGVIFIKGCKDEII